MARPTKKPIESDQDDAAKADRALLGTVKRFAARGLTRQQMAEELGYKTTFKLFTRLVKASQRTGLAVPPFPERGGGRSRIQSVEVRRRGRGEAFGVNIPQEPLDRLGAKPGDGFRVIVGKRKIVLSPVTAVAAAKAEPRRPRLIKKRHQGGSGTLKPD
jgi:antitoxin component of MazEF toxin-antitoxin module